VPLSTVEDPGEGDDGRLLVEKIGEKFKEFVIE